VEIKLTPPGMLRRERPWPYAIQDAFGEESVGFWEGSWDGVSVISCGGVVGCIAGCLVVGLVGDLVTSPVGGLVGNFVGGLVG